MTEEGDKYGSLWSREELVLALYLYCQIPFAQTKASNTEVKRLAHLLGRTPSSVARKLGNFGAFDPLLAQRGVSGLTHYSKADRAAWEEFNGRWDQLVAESRDLLAFRSAQSAPLPVPAPAPDVSIEDDLPVIAQPNGPTQEPRVVMTRLYQSFFRRAVLSSYGSACCVCGLDLPALLVASHIVPWAARQDTRTDPQNGLCLCALHDKAFDRGFLSVDAGYKIVVSVAVRVSRATFTQAALHTFHHQQVRLPSRFVPKTEYLQWHMDHVFRSA